MQNRLSSQINRAEIRATALKRRLVWEFPNALCIASCLKEIAARLFTRTCLKNAQAVLKMPSMSAKFGSAVYAHALSS